jgi:hypothetical protein
MGSGRIMAKRKITKVKAKTKQGSKKISRKKRVSQVKDITPGVIDIDLFYKIVNRIQLNREPADFALLESDSAVVENIMKDLELSFKRKVKNSVAEYSVQPAPEKERGKGAEDVEELSDEILEEGQVPF